MRDLSTLTFHSTAENIVNILCRKTQNANPMFFRVLLSYYLTKVTSMMRVKIKTQDRGEIPVNLYAINLAASGQGKGHSTNIIEDQVINNFRTNFFDTTYPAMCEKNLAQLALKRANIKSVEPDIMMLEVQKEFDSLGNLAFSFDSGTTAAVKQMRHKLLMADIGSMNLEIDEIGSNLLGNSDVLSTFLELFDIGKIKQKLTKNTKENVRSEEIEGRTPTNLLLFGTPSKLLNGSKTEEEFYSFLDTGYARRCIFGYTRYATKNKTLTAEQVYDALTDKATDQYLKSISHKIGLLSDAMNYNKILTVSKDVSIALIEYRLHCENIADDFGEHEEIIKAELSHRYFKALKLAGTYGFIDGHAEITEDNLYAAICMVEESGKAFREILKRDKNYVKLAKYIVSINREVTNVDLAEDLPFYKGSQLQKADLMQLAITWGYKNQVIIKRNTINGIEFITGEALKATDLNKMIVSYSTDISDGYKNANAPFDALHKLMQQPFNHWINHHSINGHRQEDSIAPGFNMIVLDIDNGVSMVEVENLLKDFKYLIYTTKRHTDTNNRFRIIMPLNYQLFLDREQFKEFMSNIYEWLPVQLTVDTQTGQRSRKWLTNQGTYRYHDGELLDAMLFIPNTSKNDERKSIIQTYQSLNNMERWFVQHSDTGNRNNQLIRFALLLVDSGYDIGTIREKVENMNNKFPDPIPSKEIDGTIMVTVGRAIAKRGMI